MLADAREGLRFVLGNRYLRAISICTGTSNFFWSMSAALLVVYAVRELEMSAAWLGIAFSLGNIGCAGRRRSRRAASRADSASGRRS